MVSASTRFLILHGSERFLQDKYIADLRAAMTKAHGEGGFDTVVGFALSNGALFEMRVGANGSPDLRFGVGFTFK